MLAIHVYRCISCSIGRLEGIKPAFPPRCLSILSCLSRSGRSYNEDGRVTSHNVGAPSLLHGRHHILPRHSKDLNERQHYFSTAANQSDNEQIPEEGELVSIHDHLDELHTIPLEDVRNFCIIAHVVSRRIQCTLFTSCTHYCSHNVNANLPSDDIHHATFFLYNYMNSINRITGSPAWRLEYWNIQATLGKNDN